MPLLKNIGTNIILIQFCLCGISVVIENLEENKSCTKFYDFIIVGAGSAGSVLAYRLSQNPKVRVLVLEAGGDPTPQSEIPLNYVSLSFTEMDWQYSTEPQKYCCLGLNNQQLFWPRGKALGGTSSINGMMYTRGNKLDFDYWKALGNEGWSFKDILHYFKKSEDNRNEQVALDREYHSQGGLLTVDNIRFKSKLADAFLQSLSDEGYPIRSDINGNNQTGVTLFQVTQRDGARCSTNKAFIEPAKSRKNLTILKNVLVTKILFHKSKRAYAVLFEDHLGNQSCATAGKEIILSAGTINTPQLLMLSGVGPRKHLKSLGIDVVADLPGVGENLQDQVSVNGLIFTINQPLSIMQSRITKEDFDEYKHNRTGVLTSNSVESIAFINSKNADAIENWPDIELIFSPFSSVPDKSASAPRLVNFKNNTWEEYYLPYGGQDTFGILPVLLRPKSTGNIRLRSKDPKEHPIINPNYLKDPRDLAALVAATRKVVDIGNSVHFQQYGAKLFEKPTPGCEDLVLHSDKYWECLIRHQTVAVHHIVGTVKMGPMGDPMAVVDSKLRVYKVKGLRVVDASIMPTVPSGHTNVPAIMIGEKAADMIMDSWPTIFNNVPAIIVGEKET